VSTYRLRITHECPEATLTVDQEMVDVTWPGDRQDALTPGRMSWQIASPNLQASPLFRVELLDETGNVMAAGDAHMSISADGGVTLYGAGPLEAVTPHE
jgi:hypothetical protein